MGLRACAKSQEDGQVSIQLDTIFISNVSVVIVVDYVFIPAGRDGILGARFGGSQGSTDLEAGGGYSHSSEPAAAVSAFIGSISGLVRRQVSSLHSHSGSAGSTAAYSSVNSAEPVLPVATVVDTDGVNSSDGSATDRDSKDFLLKVRVCSLIDVVGLVYRSALPTILWAEYFATCATIGTVLQVIYLAVKLYDCTWKVKGAAQAIYLFTSNTLVINCCCFS